MQGELDSSQPTDGTPGMVKCERPDCEMCEYIAPTTSGNIHKHCSLRLLFTLT